MKNYFYVFFISMVPLVELRGAIPAAYFIKANDPTFNLLTAYILIAIGNMLPMPIIYFFARKVLEWGKDKPVIGGFFTFCLEKGEKGGKKLTEKAGRSTYPLPGTGGWTGTLAASILDMDFKSTILAVVCGIALAGCIIGLLCTLGLGAYIGVAV